MRRRRGKEKMTLNAEINVVSLIDVMMLLLVIFMLTAPMMTTGLDINLPEADAKPIESTGGITISVDRSGSIRVNETAMSSIAQLQSTLNVLARRTTEKTAKLQMDKSVTWDVQAPVLTAINKAGLDVGFVMNPVTEPPK